MRDQVSIIKVEQIYFFTCGLPAANPDGLIPTSTDQVSSQLIYGDSDYIAIAITPKTSGDGAHLVVRSVLEEIWGHLWWRSLVDSSDMPEPVELDLSDLLPRGDGNLVVGADGLIRHGDEVLGRVPDLA